MCYPSLPEGKRVLGTFCNRQFHSGQAHKKEKRIRKEKEKKKRKRKKEREPTKHTDTMKEICCDAPCRHWWRKNKLEIKNSEK